MITDERIRTTSNRISARGFLIMYFLLLIDIQYRMFYLKQSAGEWVDILGIVFIGSLYLGIALYSQGAVAGRIGRQFKIIIPVVIISIIATRYFQGDINSVRDLLMQVVLGVVVGIPSLLLVFFFFYYLNRRWEKKNELD